MDMIKDSAFEKALIEAISEERFMILPHPSVKQYLEKKVSDYDRWLAGMRRLRARFQPS